MSRPLTPRGRARLSRALLWLAGICLALAVAGPRLIVAAETASRPALFVSGALFAVWVMSVAASIYLAR